MNPVDPSKVYRLLYPAVPAIVACEVGGRVYAMSAVSMVSLSAHPPLIGVSSSRSHSTYRAILKARCFSVCWVDDAQAPALEFLGTTPRRSDDKLASAGLRHKEGKELGVPLVKGAVATLECALKARRRFGDHDLLVGEVRDARAGEDFQGYWRFESYKPVLYAGMQGGSFKTYRP
jgi:flavin reductase (DIM6/NTAB) family NADH-FMN oxidoreductase RutF